jgi:hypothetical protein
VTVHRIVLLVCPLIALALYACSRDEPSSPAQQAPAEPDRVVGVTIACTYQTWEGPRPVLGSTDQRSVVARDGTGDYCKADTPYAVDAVAVLKVTNRRAQITVRTAAGGAHTVETTDLTVKVGDPWPK